MTDLVVDSWYHRAIGGRKVEDLLETLPRWVQLLCDRSGLCRGIAIARLATGSAIVTVRAQPGAGTLLLLLALFGRRKLVLLEYIYDTYPSHAWWRTLARRCHNAVVEGPCLRRVLLVAQVLTHQEALQYAEKYRVPPARFVFCPWAFREDDRPLPENARRSNTVLCSAGSGSDWSTIIHAARDQSWQLVVICRAQEVDYVAELAAGATNICILGEVPKAMHEQQLRKAAVYALVVRPGNASRGQIRAMNAAQAGTPVVASDVPGLREYVEPGVTALLVPPQDPAALSNAIAELLRDDDLRRRLGEAAYARGATRLMEDYLRDVSSLVRRATVQR